MRTRDHFSAISHSIGAVLSLIGIILLLSLAVRRGDVWRIVGLGVFSASVLLLYVASALYHFFLVSSRVRSVFKRLDHSFIFILIAGTFTPICLIVLRGPLGWSLLGVIWALSIGGIVVKNVWAVPTWASTTSYVLMGWLVIIAIVPLYRLLPFVALVWLLLGGVFYTMGAIFYALDEEHPSQQWFNLHDLFHLFVIGGSISHFLFMFYLV